VDIIDAARSDGFELDEKPLDGRWVWVWHRGDDWRWPCFLSEREAVNYMADRLRRIAIFKKSHSALAGPSQRTFRGPFVAPICSRRRNTVRNAENRR
jgi:hypothetical protein